MSRAKLLFLVTEDWYFVSHRLPLAIAARNAGFEVVVATRAGPCARVIQDAGLRLLPFELSRRGGNPLRELVALVTLYHREKPAIVHHVALKPVLMGMLAARFVGVPATLNAVAGLGWLFMADGLLPKVVRLVVRRLLARLLASPKTLTIVQNPDDCALLVKSGVPAARLRLIRGAGVDTQIFSPGGPPPRPLTVMLVARMLWDKGIGEFLEAARILHNEGIPVRFVLVGNPDPANPASIDEKVLQNWNGNYGIECLGRREDIPALLQQAHIACLPSYREGLPKSLLEAAACGLPIVATDVPGCREVVCNGSNGFLVPVHDANALASALKKLILDPDLRRRMGEASRVLALAEFSQAQVIAETLAVYRELRP